MLMEEFERDMAAFSLGQHQDALTYLDQLERCGWTVEDARAWVASRRKELTRMPARPLVFRCPDCKAPMQLLMVNVGPATQTNDDSKSVWFCTNKKCMNTIYNKKSVEEILRNKGK